jgi:hypothetical protein
MSLRFALASSRRLGPSGLLELPRARCERIVLGLAVGLGMPRRLADGSVGIAGPGRDHEEDPLPPD